MSKANKIWLVIGIIVIIAIILIIVLSKEKPEEEGVIKIGFTTPLSGSYAYIGEDVLRGVEEIINETNQKGLFDRKIELVVEDNQASTTTAVTNYNLFKAKDINIVFCSFSSITEALTPIAERDKTILMYEAIPTNFAEDNEYIFKVYSNAKQEAEIISEEVRKISSTNAWVYVNNPTSIVMDDIFSAELPDLKKYKFEINEEDFRTIILKLKNDNIESVILNGYPKQILNFVKQSIEQGYNLKRLFVVSDGGSADVVDNIEDFIGDSDLEYILVGYGSLSKEIYYVFSHDLTKVLISGMESCQKLGKEPDDPECLKEELKRVSISGKSGDITMTDSGIAELSPSLYVVENKELVLYEE